MHHTITHLAPGDANFLATPDTPEQPGILAPTTATRDRDAAAVCTLGVGEAGGGGGGGEEGEEEEGGVGEGREHPKERVGGFYMALSYLFSLVSSDVLSHSHSTLDSL